MSIKNKFATAVATASLLAGLFGSAFVPSALAAREVPLDTPSVAKTETWSGDYNQVVPVLGSNADLNGLDRAFYMTTIDREYQSDYGDNVGDDLGNLEASDIDALDDEKNDSQYIEYILYTKNGADVEEANLKATSSSSVVKVLWSFDNNGAYDNCVDVDGTAALVDEVTEVTDVDGEYNLCLVPNGKAGVATISVVANGVTLAPVTVTVLGDLASLTIVADGQYVAEDNYEVSDFFTVTGKDSAGNILNGPELGVAGGLYLDDAIFGTLEADAENPVNQQGDEIAFIDSSTDDNGALTATGLSNFSWNQVALLENACVSETATGEADGDAGKSYSLKASILNEDADAVISNAITMTCTGAEADAKLSKFEVEATSGDLDYTDDVDDVISVYGYFTDQAGRPLGAGATVDLDDDFVLDISASATFEGDLNITLYTSADMDGTNKTEIAYLEPDMSYVAKFPYTISVEYADPSVSEASKSLATFYTAVNPDAIVYTLSVVRNAAKTRATITVNFGAECSNQMVDFDVELANGDVKFLERRANIDGVAKLTMERRNTKIYVTAFCNDGAQYTTLRGVRFR